MSLQRISHGVCMPAHGLENAGRSRRGGGNLKKGMAELHVGENPRHDSIVTDEGNLRGRRNRKRIEGGRGIGQRDPLARQHGRENPFQVSKRSEDPRGGLPGDLTSVALPLGTGGVEDEEPSDHRSDDRAAEADECLLSLVSGHRGASQLPCCRKRPP